MSNDLTNEGYTTSPTGGFHKSSIEIALELCNAIANCEPHGRITARIALLEARDVVIFSRAIRPGILWFL